ncbi:MAG: hypothetical protein JNJ83_11370 [Verrucomicrobiaceae bacterium]|nr:hypothetical protein [Verrucomicrobiaceae bacterium]
MRHLLFFLLFIAAHAAYGQYYYRDYRMDAAHQQLDRAEWDIYHMNNLVDDAEALHRQAVANTDARRRAANQQNAVNNAEANRLNARANLVDQATRINAAYSKRLDQAKADIAAESRRAEKGAEDAERGLAALLAWQEQIAARHAANQQRFKTLFEVADGRAETLLLWDKINADRDFNLHQDQNALLQKQRELNRRIESIQQRQAQLQARKIALGNLAQEHDALEASQKERAEKQAESRGAFIKRMKERENFDNDMGDAYEALAKDSPVVPFTEQEVNEAFKYRTDISDKCNDKVFEELTVPIESVALDKVRKLTGWFDEEGHLRRILFVEAMDEKSHFVQYYFWRTDGTLHSVFQVGNGKMTGDKDRTHTADELYYRNGRLATWQTLKGESWVPVDDTSYEFINLGRRTRARGAYFGQMLLDKK